MRSDTINTVLLAVLLGALIYIGCEQVILSRKMLVRLETTHMTDPGPQTLKGEYLKGYQDVAHTIPLYEVIETTRDAPSETVTHWVDRHAQAIKDRMEIVPPWGG